MWMQMIADTITNPRETARHLITMNPPMAIRWQGFVLLTILRQWRSAGRLLCC